MTSSRAAAERPRIVYQPEIDGLRAVAVIGVVLFHAGFGFPGGYTGVDVFFVISGYLITSLIISDIDAGMFTLSDFWERRIRRIFPPLIAMLTVVIGAAYLLLMPEDLIAFSKSLGAQAFMVANVHAWRDTGYFAVAAELRPLLHMWSLAVEEQFYLILPALLLLAGKWPRRRLIAALLVVFLGSLCLSILGTWRAPSATFFLLPTRAWELLAGSLLALVGARTVGRSLRESASWAGLGAILASMLLFSRTTTFPGFAALLPVAGAGLIIFATRQGGSLVGTFLATRPMVFFGRISYPLYLWHWPLLAFSRYIYDAETSTGMRVAICCLSVLLSVISLHWVENPIRQRRIMRSRSSLFGGALAASASVALVAAGLWWTDGAAGRVPESLRFEEGVPARASLDLVRQGQLPVLGDPGRGEQPQFLVWGDSHAGMFLSVFDKLGRDHGVSGLIGASGGNPPLPGVDISWNADLREWNAGILAEIESKQIRHVFLIGRWASYIEGSTQYDISQGRFLQQPLLYDRDQKARSPETSRSLFELRLAELLDRLADAGCRVYVFAQVPEQSFNPARRQFVELRTAGILGVDRSGANQDEHRARQARVNAILKSLQGKGLQVFDPGQSLFDAAGQSLIRIEGRLTYRDQQHLSDFGVNLIARSLLLPVFREMQSEAAQMRGHPAQKKKRGKEEARTSNIPLNSDHSVRNPRLSRSLRIVMLRP